MDRFFVRDGLTHKPVSATEWNRWHDTLNEKKGDWSRTVDKHTLSKGKQKTAVITMFTGGPTSNYVTFIKNKPGMQEYSNTLGIAKANHHAIIAIALEEGWSLDPKYDPSNYKE